MAFKLDGNPMTWLLNQQSNGKALKDIFDSRIMAEKYESFARRNPGDVLTYVVNIKSTPEKRRDGGRRNAI
jgi:hypothetical protein